jgi:hypothetical protein
VFPDTPQGFRRASVYGGAVPHVTDKVIIANRGTAGFTVSDTTVAITYNGSVVTQHDVRWGPVFLAPGESRVQYYGATESPNPVEVSWHVLFGSKCRVTGWR